MVGEKGLEASAADKIGEYVKLKGGMKLVERLTADEALSNNKSAKAALDDMKLLLQYVDLFGITDKVRTDVTYLLTNIKQAVNTTFRNSFSLRSELSNIKDNSCRNLTPPIHQVHAKCEQLQGLLLYASTSL